MENASKALIIAGAILLAILLISLGIFIFGQAQDTVNNSGMSQAEISTFNSKFLKYEGVQKGTIARTLINEVVSSNSDDNNKSHSAIVNIKLDSKTDTDDFESNADKDNPIGKTVKIKTNGIKTTSSYEISMEYSGGRVNKITITEK